ncbi:hypothetical protein CRENBAI_023086 [Crenichthys baileyi]|uniref:Secreted protein n=1 Tax=Crenichthys baileyi TaxID=28760 RepID=A0AAV9RI52_9TELE
MAVLFCIVVGWLKTGVDWPSKHVPRSEEEIVEAGTSRTQTVEQPQYDRPTCENEGQKVEQMEFPQTNTGQVTSKSWLQAPVSH